METHKRHISKKFGMQGDFRRKNTEFNHFYDRH